MPNICYSCFASVRHAGSLKRREGAPTRCQDLIKLADSPCVAVSNLTKSGWAWLFCRTALAARKVCGQSLACETDQPISSDLGVRN